MTHSGLRVNGSSATEIIAPTTEAVPLNRWTARQMSMADFIENKGSGTLRKNNRVGFNTKSQALHERIAYEFGYQFECLMERCVTWGQARSEGDSSALTECGWFAERYADVCLFPGDEIEVKYIIVEEGHIKREGIGLVVRKTSAQWVPQGYMVFAIITEYDYNTHDFKPAKNPC
jgi:hypothetical protein